MTLGAVDGVLTRQVFLRGRVRDAVSGAAPLTPPRLLLRRQGGGEPYPLAARKLEDGQYAFSGDPLRAFPPLEAGETLNLELVVSAPRYGTATVPVSFTAADLALSSETRTIQGQEVELPRLAALPRVLDVALAPEPPALTGRVVAAENPALPLAGASVRVTAPAPAGPVTSDASGYYTLTGLPAAVEATVEVSLAGRETLTTPLRLDYRQPLQEQHFFLTEGA